ncbi:MAG: 1-(5-phosphoribosyl)-5-[(5-phosphoribosylamino)methylideneamino]imidazole-4-carboxamide isomerase [Lentisphaerae bacterium]|nr:1-(5-phosphoribosyl)-5-[(5-phosphoribosylamino)methylideneamino]imidazole-4-carboxamide isomerase [Lentisphaerota bacterium]
MFDVIPAVDLKAGRCVRLRQGLADQETVYSGAPSDMARHWADQGARLLHVVDLDGAFQGRPVHTREILAMAGAIGIPVEAGGGIRTDAHVRALLDGGVARVIVGTRACESPETLAEWIRAFGDRLAVGIDAKDSRVRVRGWTEDSGLDAVAFARQIGELGAAAIIFTDTATDGMLSGPNIASVAAVCDAVRCSVIASGGVASAADIRALLALRRENLAGAIVGKALYEKRASFGELAAAARG